MRFIGVLVAAAVWVGVWTSLAASAAQEFSVGAITITNPWTRATPKGVTIGSAYMTITNNAAEADRLLTATSAVAARLQVHEMSSRDGIMMMRPLEEGLEIKAGETIALAPGSFHLMLFGLKRPLVDGDRIATALEFARAGKVEVQYVVEAIGARSPQGGVAKRETMFDMLRSSLGRLLATGLRAGASEGTFTAPAQQARPPVIGFLTGASRAGIAPYLAAFRQGLWDTGFVESHNVTIEGRFADDHYERLPALAAELIERRVAIIAGDPRGYNAARAMTNTIPIVFMGGEDPVRRGAVARLDRPGGNLTGVSLLATDLNAKRFGLFHDLVPRTALIGVLSDSTNFWEEFTLEQVKESALRLEVPIKVISVGTESEIEAAFATFAREGVSAVFFNNGFLFFSLRARLNELALRYRMASSGEAREFANDGALMSYGPSIPDAFRKVGVYAGRILMGEKPGDLPVQLPTKFEFVINLKTANAIGLTLPQDIVTIADEVIE